MKKFNSLIDIYYNDLYPVLNELENERIEIAKKLRIIQVIFVLMVVTVIYLTYKYNLQDSGDIIFSLITLLLIIYVYIQKILTKDYVYYFKNSVIKKLIKSFDSSLKYDPNGYFPPALYNSSKLFLKKYDRYSGNDLVSGQIDGISIIFSDIKTEYKTKDSKGRTHWHTIFKGLFFMADFNKNFKGITLVYPDFAQKFFGDFGQFLQEFNKKYLLSLVKMDHPEFEKEFVVYSNDQIEARYILTPNLMEKLVAFRKKVNQPIYLSFVNNHIFIAIYGQDHFEPTIFKSLLDFDVAKNYIETIKFSLGLVEELNLNRKIWSRV